MNSKKITMGKIYSVQKYGGQIDCVLVWSGQGWVGYVFKIKEGKIDKSVCYKYDRWDACADSEALPVHTSTQKALTRYLIYTDYK